VFVNMLQGRVGMWLCDYCSDLRSCFCVISVLQRDLILYYRSTCSDFQISPIFDEYVPNLLEFHVSPTLTCVDLVADGKQNKLFQTTSIERYHDIFVKNHQICQHIYISSPAGCGKTSFAKQMALSWCQAHQPIKSDYYWCKEVEKMQRKVKKYLNEWCDGLVRPEL